MRKAGFCFILGVMLFLPACLSWAGIFRDDFEDGDYEGWVPNPKAEQIAWKDGEVVITDTDRHTPTQLAFNYEQSLRDFTASFDCMMTKVLDNSPYIWLFFRINDEDSIGAFACFLPHELWISMIKWAVNQYPGVVKIPFTTELNRWYHAEVMVKGKTVSMWVDGKLKGKADWTSWKILPESGEVVIGGGGAEIHLDNVVLIGEEVPDAGPSGFNSTAVRAKGKLAVCWASLKGGQDI